jgi:hypothetical protein
MKALTKPIEVEYILYDGTNEKEIVDWLYGYNKGTKKLSFEKDGDSFLDIEIGDSLDFLNRHYCLNVGSYLVLQRDSLDKLEIRSYGAKEFDEHFDIIEGD